MSIKATASFSLADQLFSAESVGQLARVGEAFCWQFNLVSRTRQILKSTLHIHFLKSNYTLAPKDFTVRDAEFLKGQSILINKRQSFKPITTRTLYPGWHHAELVINGVPCTKRSFDLLA